MQSNQQYSSLFNVCGDGKVSPLQAAGYFLGNIANITHAKLAENKDARTYINLGFTETLKQEYTAVWKNHDSNSSPTRKLSNLFWSLIDWEALQTVLGQEINLLDLGCGSGAYYHDWQRWSGQRIHSYHGLDTHPHPQWDTQQKQYPQTSFAQVPEAFASSYIPSHANLLLTQSAIEHFQYDKLFFSEMAHFTHKNKRSFIQIHLVPSAACLPLYMLHGYRQYQPHTIHHELFTYFDPDHTRFAIYPMGGSHCNRLHRQVITWRSLVRRRQQAFAEMKTAAYEQKLKDAITADLSRPLQSPSFYAIVIASHIPNWTGLFSPKDK